MLVEAKFDGELLSTDPVEHAETPDFTQVIIVVKQTPFFCQGPSIVACVFSQRTQYYPGIN